MRELSINNLDVVELNSDQQQHIEGGNPWVAFLVGWGGGKLLDSLLENMSPHGEGGYGPSCDNV